MQFLLNCSFEIKRLAVCDRKTILFFFRTTENSLRCLLMFYFSKQIFIRVNFLAFDLAYVRLLQVINLIAFQRSSFKCLNNFDLSWNFSDWNLYIHNNHRMFSPDNIHVKTIALNFFCIRCLIWYTWIMFDMYNMPAYQSIATISNF